MYKINDLMVTGGHFILVDELPEIENPCSFYELNLKIDDKYCLLVSDYDEAEKQDNDSIYTIYHLVLDGDNERYGIYVKCSEQDIILSESTNEANFLKQGFY